MSYYPVGYHTSGRMPGHHPQWSRSIEDLIHVSAGRTDADLIHNCHGEHVERATLIKLFKSDAFQDHYPYLEVSEDGLPQEDAEITICRRENDHAGHSLRIICGVETPEYFRAEGMFFVCTHKSALSCGAVTRQRADMTAHQELFGDDHGNSGKECPRCHKEYPHRFDLLRKHFDKCVVEATKVRIHLNNKAVETAAAAISKSPKKTSRAHKKV